MAFTKVNVSSILTRYFDYVDSLDYGMRAIISRELLYLTPLFCAVYNQE